MCGSTEGNLGNKFIVLDIGYNGGIIKADDEVIYSNHHYSRKGSREEFMKYFGKFSRVDLLNMLADFVENADEG